MVGRILRSILFQVSWQTSPMKSIAQYVPSLLLVWILLGICGALILTGILARITLGLVRSNLVSRVRARYRPDQILLEDRGANFFGRQSAGVLQVRGNGSLVLTATDLHFFMLVPKSEICIPLSSIREMTITKHHLHKVTPFDLLKLVFSESDQIDSIAWYLSDPIMWKKRIEALQADGLSAG